MKRNYLTIVAAFSMSMMVSCGGGEKADAHGEEHAAPTTHEEENHEEDEVVVETSFYGDFTLTEMVPVPGDKELTEQDEEYIAQSKERTIGHTILTLNEDGSFKRVFPHPSGNGETKEWNGSYVMDEEAGVLTFNVEMDDKTMPMEFKIEEKSDSKLSVTTGFGQIEMTYVYTK